MSDSAIHFSDISAHEQEIKGVETGFDERKAVEFIREISSTWKEAGRLDVQLLRGLCELTLDEEEKATAGFTSWELVEAISRVRGRAWSDSDDKNRMSDDIRQQWNNLLKTWGMKSEGVVQQLIDAGFTHVPLLDKTEGGGAGNPTRYRMVWGTAATEQVGCPPDPHVESPAKAQTTLRYVCEDIEEANPLARIFARGFQLKGWRRQLYLVAVGTPLVFLWVLILLVSLSVTVSSTIGPKTALTSVLSLAIIVFAVIRTIGPLYRLVDDQIVIAPWWMQSVDDDRLLERRAPPRYSHKAIKAVRYASKCPLCGGRVIATKGRLEFFGRIVGRCEEAPVEHVFSFDHVTRAGRWLRSV